MAQDFSEDLAHYRDRIDDLCDQFESAWTSGEAPNLMEFMTLDESLADHQKSLLKELLELDVHYRQEHGLPVTRQIYIEQLGTEFAQLIDAAIPLSIAPEGQYELETKLSIKEYQALLIETDIVSASQLGRLTAKLSDSQTSTLIRHLIEEGVLTLYQASRLCANDPESLKLGQYLILDVLGQGGMGVVYRAVHRRMKREVAIKLLSPKVLHQPGAVDRFYREVQAAAKLLHPNIVTAFDADEDAGQHFLVMEYVRGRDLSHVLNDKGPLPVRTVVDYMIQAATGLEFAHQQHLVHRDIKPANLLVDGTGSVKILDMGLARMRQREMGSALESMTANLTQTGQIMGTVDYMAPEQAMDVRSADHRADIYSLGCTMYRLLTGAPLYDGDSLMQRLQAHREAELPSLLDERPGCGADLAAVLSKMVAKKPEDRQQSMAEVIEELKNCSIPETTDAHEETDDARREQTYLGGVAPTAHPERVTTERDTAISISERFGRYEIQKVLGQGAMGAVYLARDTQLDRDVALKIPKFGEGVERDDLLERFYREARAAATLRSPNICPVYDVGEIDGQHYITMAYIEGRPLRDFTKSKKKHAEKQIVKTIRKLAVGLSQAHKIGVIHRDLKPANVMVDTHGEPVVMDFGLARRSSANDAEVTQSNAILGTPAYMSPEQVASEQGLIGPQTDIFSLGVIMYELMTGELPFQGHLMSILQQIAINKPTPPTEHRPDLDPRLEQICQKMMASDLADRYQSMEEVAADLQKWMTSPRKKEQSKPAKKIPSPVEESNPELISIIEPKSFAEQLREKKGLSPTRTKTTTPPSDSWLGHSRNLIIATGLGGLLLLLGIMFLVRVGKYDVQITLDDPTITLSVDGKTLNINDGNNVIKLSAGKHQLQLEKDGLKTQMEPTRHQWEWNSGN